MSPEALTAARDYYLAAGGLVLSAIALAWGVYLAFTSGTTERRK